VAISLNDNERLAPVNRRLDDLLGQLLGNGPKVGAAAGLARLRQERLQSIQRAASTRSRDCLHGLQNLSRLLAVALNHPEAHLRVEEFSGSAEHLTQLATDLECWLELAENAEFYCERRDVASTITQLWAQSAHALGELPSVSPVGPRAA
jgi:hypothetical protein